MRGRPRLTVMLTMIVAFILSAAEPSDAHPTDSFRTLPYNVKVNRQDGSCGYEVIHGNYNGGYINKKMSVAACDFIDVQVTACDGFFCPSGAYAATTTPYMWISSQAPPPYLLAESHDFTDDNNFFFRSWHNYCC